MNSANLSEDEKVMLLRLARQALECYAAGEKPPELDLAEYSPALREQGASFVTLTHNGDLRGCIGALEAYQPLVEDVVDHVIAAACEDPRFHPVRPHEVPRLHIEISRLTNPAPLLYKNPEDLPALLRPRIDGVILRDGPYRATFLPQVWEKVPDPEQFLTHLCQKMGLPGSTWRKKLLQVFTYQVEVFEEEK